MTDYRVWPATNGPNTDAGDPAAPVNLGLIFQMSSTCWVKAIHFYRGATTITGTPKGRVFLVSGQTVVSGTAVNFPTLSGVGWQTATLAAPVQLTANTSYKVTVHFDDNYTASGGYWASGAGVSGITNGPLTAPDAGGTPLGIGSIKQGSFGYTSDPDVYPDSYFNGGNYWVDITVTDVDPSHTGTGTAPLTLSTSSTGGKRITAAGSATLALNATRVGAKVAVGTATAGLGLAATGIGTHRGVNSAAAQLALAATRTGVHRGVGTGTAPLTLGAIGTQPGRDLRLSIGRTGAPVWDIGPAQAMWSVGEAGAT